MKQLTPILFVALLQVAGKSSAQQQVDRKGLTAAVKFEQVMSGHLTDLNGKYKLRVTETTIEPGGHQGDHHHVGPGIRYLASGELTFVQSGKTTVYKAGDYYFESGDVTHSAYNKGSVPVVNVIFEILPADWKGGSAILPQSK
jgi:quercetin dioxygenase-like cupin family protein